MRFFLFSFNLIVIAIVSAVVLPNLHEIRSNIGIRAQNSEPALLTSRISQRGKDAASSRLLNPRSPTEGSEPSSEDSGEKIDPKEVKQAREWAEKLSDEEVVEAFQSFVSIHGKIVSALFFFSFGPPPPNKKIKQKQRLQEITAGANKMQKEEGSKR